MEDTVVVGVRVNTPLMVEEGVAHLVAVPLGVRREVPLIPPTPPLAEGEVLRLALPELLAARV